MLYRCFVYSALCYPGKTELGRLEAAMEDDNDAGTLLYLCGCSPTTTNRGNDDDDDVLERNAVLDSTSWLRKRKETEQQQRGDHEGLSSETGPNLAASSNNRIFQKE